MKVKNVNIGLPSYHAHIAPDKVFLDSKKLMATFRVEGIQADSLPDSTVENLFINQKEFLVGLCRSGGVHLWAHLIKKESVLSEKYVINDVFLQAFYRAYAELFKSVGLYTTRYYLTVGIEYDDIDEADERLSDIINQIQAAFKSYRISAVSVTEDDCSEMSGEYLNFLFNNETAVLPLSATKITDSIRNSEIYFNYDFAEIKPDSSPDNKFCTNYIVKDFPRTTTAGQWNFLLSLPYEFIVTQSFIAETPAKSNKRIDQQLNKMSSVGDAGETQAAELEAGLESVISQETLFGSHCCVLTAFGNTPETALDNGAKIASEFITSGRGFRFIKCTSSAPFAYFSHLPLSTHRPLASTRTLTNFCCLMPFHNHSYGKQSGNPIGDGSAIMPLKTTHDGLYYFNTHYSAPGKKVTGQKIAGHALILGATGAGKTTFECAAAAFLQRFDPYLFVIDFNRSTELAVRAFGGQYFALKEGGYTGINPFQIGSSDDAELMAFLKAWVKRCAVHNDGTPCDDFEAQEIDLAVEMVMKLERPERRFAALQYRIQSRDLKMRLAKWWGEGALAWALDSPENRFNPDDAKKVGFDTTVILESTGGKDHPACEALLTVLFFFKNRMQKEGQLMLSIVEEFWKPANFPMTQDLIKASLKAGRMKGEMMWLTSQSPEDAINCPLYAAIIQQTPTKIFLPNPDMAFDGYLKSGLTEKECTQLKKLGLESRTMLIKQSGSSVFAKMDLYGFDDYLPVISGSKEGIALCEKIRAFAGSDAPEVWVKPLVKALKIKKAVIQSCIDEHGTDDETLWFPVLMREVGVTPAGTGLTDSQPDVQTTIKQG